VSDIRQPSPGEGAVEPGGERAIYNEMAKRDDFVELRRRYTSFAFPATAAFMIWYITYVICNNWARDFMNTKVIGNINVALVFGLLQFVSTFVIAYLYSRHANTKLDPLATELREDFDERTGR
jgi:uncharacterized membrane protein (DUF485 family)